MKASDNVFPKLLLTEVGGVATPAADTVAIIRKASGLFMVDEAGDEYQLTFASDDFAVAAGTGDAMTATLDPAPVALTDGMHVFIRAIDANTIVAPTLDLNGLGAFDIIKHNLVPLVAGDIAGAGHELLLVYNEAESAWLLLNPAVSSGGGGGGGGGGGVDTAWASEPTTITGVTSNPTKGTIVTDKIYWRRIGDSMEILIDYQQSAAGTGGSGTYLFLIPDGQVADTAKVRVNPSSTYPTVATIGTGAATDQTSFTRSLHASLHDSTHIQLGDTVTGFMGSGNMQLGGGGNMSVSARCVIPIVGWDVGAGGGGGGGSTLVAASAPLGAAATSVSVSGLDLDTDGEYEIRFFGKQNGTDGYIAMTFNADTTATNYNNIVQYYYSGSGAGGAAANNGRVFYGSDAYNFIGRLTKDLNGRPKTDIQGGTGAPSGMYLWHSHHRWATAGANVTGITFTHDTANGFDVGSYFEVWKK